MRTLLVLVLVLALAASVAAASASAEETTSPSKSDRAARAAEGAAAPSAAQAAAIDRDVVARLLPGFYPEDAAPHSKAGALQSVSPDDLTAALVDYAGCEALGEALAFEVSRVAAGEREAAAEASQGD